MKGKKELIDCSNKTIDEIYNLIQTGYRLELDWKTVKEVLPVHTLSKADVSIYEPVEETFLISVQDYQRKELPFEERTNHITRELYKDTLFLFFDDLYIWEVKRTRFPQACFSKGQADLIIFTLDKWFENESPTKIINHCEAGLSRSQAIALFVARYYYKDEKLFTILNNVKDVFANGNDLVYKLLLESYTERYPKSLILKREGKIRIDDFL